MTKFLTFFPKLKQKNMFSKISKKILLTLLISVIALLLTAPANSQVEEKVTEKKDFSLAFDFGGNIFFNEEGYSKSNDMTFNAMNVNLMYNFGNNEIGIFVGRSDALEKKNTVLVFYPFFPADTSVYYFPSKTLESKTYYRFGISYKYNFNDIFNVGLKYSGGTYFEFSIGKNFKVNKDIFVYGNLNFSTVDGGLFIFEGSNNKQLGFNAGVKFNLF